MFRSDRTSCALCLEEAQLCLSHVFPEFLYEGTYDETGRNVAVTLAHPRSAAEHSVQILQKGQRERLLCATCEGRLSIYERYSASLLRRIRAKRVDPADEALYIDYDYALLKLFGLSLTWRAHVARGWLFNQATLGPVAEDHRRLLLTGDPGRPEDFQFALFRLVGAGIADHFVHSPGTLRIAGYHAQAFLAGGFRWLFLTSRNAPLVRGLVGSEPWLTVPIERTSDERLMNEVRRRLPRRARIGRPRASGYS